MKITIGGLVLCYLLGTGTNQNNQEVIKVWGEVVEFKERDALYDKDRNTPVAYVQRVDDLIVRGVNRKGIYQINVNACKPVEKLPKYADRPEFEEVRLEKEKIDVEIDENYNVVEKSDVEEEKLSAEDKATKVEDIKKMIAEKKKEDDELRKAFLADQRKKLKAQEAREAEIKEVAEKEAKEAEANSKQTPSQIKGQKHIEEKGVFDYLFDK